MKDLNHYMNLPYTIVLKRDEEGDFLAHLEEIPNCRAHGGSVDEAIAHLEEMKRLWFEESIESNQAIPEPSVEGALPSGKWLQRVPRTLHKKLSILAVKEGISLNQLVSNVLAEAVGRRSTVTGVDEIYEAQIIDELTAAGWKHSWDSHGQWAEPGWCINQPEPYSRPHKTGKLIGNLHLMTLGFSGQKKTNLKAVENAEKKEHEHLLGH